MDAYDELKDTCEEEYILKETTLPKLCEEIEHEEDPPYLNLVEYVFPNRFSMIPTFPLCLLPSLRHKRHLSSFIVYYVMRGPSFNVGHVNQMFNLL